MSYSELMEKAAVKTGSIVCMGADPVLEKIPIPQGSAEGKISRFFEQILEACEGEGCLPGAVKPNYAFYAQYGFDGLRALEKVCKKVREKGIPLIIDAKRGDIGKTSAAYAKEVFGLWQGDCVTIAPYMGVDSVMPFIEATINSDKGVYILNRTSNPGASDFQDLESGGKKMFELMADNILKWSDTAPGNVGAVVGATSIGELEALAKQFAESRKDIPMLIPGVGAQGGSAAEVTAALKKVGYKVKLARINSSSGINYAYEKDGTDDFAGAAAKAVKELNKEIGEI